MIELSGPLLLVGAGKMGGALLAGWLERGLSPNQVFVRDPSPPPEVLALLDARGIAHGPAPELPAAPAVILLAVKPQLMDDVLPDVAPLAGPETAILSIAAGRTLQSLARHFSAESAILRAMPNTPAAIGRGITAVFANAHANATQKSHCQTLLEAAGEVLWVDDEALLDPVTAVSGSGPAYVFLLTECLAEAGVDAGLAPDLALALARATVAGAGELMRQSDLNPSQLRENVTSPHGTTAAALKVLMAEDGLQSLMTHAIAAAAKRSVELSS